MERRIAWVRSGDSTPIDLTMTNGAVIRCQLAKLPGGGRIHSDVTDIVRNAEEMERLATIDGMTGIHNRRHFLTLADREWERSQRYGRPLSFLTIDIDNFKRINDRFGHEASDHVIVHLAELARVCKRDSDVLARIGGEEFALLLPETGPSEAEAVAERLREQVSSSRFPMIDHRYDQRRRRRRRREHRVDIRPDEARRSCAVCRQARRQEQGGVLLAGGGDGRSRPQWLALLKRAVACSSAATISALTTNWRT